MRILVGVFLVALLALPSLIPNVDISTPASTALTANTAAFDNTATMVVLPLVDVTITVTPGGQAQAFSAMAWCCRRLRLEMCCEMQDNGWE